jgi:site-specific recombinase XerD
MLTDYPFAEQTLERLRRGAAGVYLDDFTAWLAEGGYAQTTIRSYIYAADRFLTWGQATGQVVSALDADSLARYKAHLAATAPAWRRAGEVGNTYCGARRMVVFLRQRGAVSDERSTDPLLLTAFGNWMHQHRGVTQATIATYAPVLRRLLEALGSEPETYTAAQLRAFVLAQSQGYSHSKAETVVTAVRMFVRFLIATGQCAEALESAIPRLARWRQAALPRYLKPAVVERIIAGCDPSTPLGARDRAVLLLLARLALRAGDVAGLRLKDIDWPRGRLRVSGKTRQEAWLPLPQGVGDAILHYLGSARPAVAEEFVFLITRAPYTPMLSRQVSHTAERAIRRAGIDAPSYGAHLFRHSTATALLHEGLSLQEIGSLLRHRDVDTTALYAKVDVGLLREVALPWPQEVAPC